MCPINFSSIRALSLRGFLERGNRNAEKKIPVVEEIETQICPCCISESTNYLHINLQAISSNISWIRSKIKGELVAYLPRFAFGLGIPALYRHLAGNGVTNIVVQTLAEGLELRGQGWPNAITVIEPISSLTFEQIAFQYLTPSVTSPADVLGLRTVAIRIDVNGDADTQKKSTGDIFQTCKGLQTPIELIYTILNDEENKATLQKQYKKFMEIVGPYRSEGVKLMCISDKAVIHGISAKTDFCGVGTMMFGYAIERVKKEGKPVQYNLLEKTLVPVVSWVCRPIHYNSFMRGAHMDGSPHGPRAENPQERLAVVAVGREDGLPDNAAGYKVRDENGDFHEFFGPLTSSLSQVKFSTDDKPSVLTLLSPAREGDTSMFHLCKESDRSPGDLLSAVSWRVPRIATEGARIASRDDVVEVSELPSWY